MFCPLRNREKCGRIIRNANCNDVILSRQWRREDPFLYVRRCGFLAFVGNDRGRSERVKDLKETLNDKFWKIINLTGTAIAMNLLFLVCCIPIVTIGQAWCGLLSGIRFMIRGDGWFEGFKTGFKTRFLRGTVAWVICLGVDVMMLLNVVPMLYYQAEGYLIPTVVSCIFLAIALMITTALPALNVYIPTSKSRWLKNAVDICVGNPLEVLAAAALIWLPVFLVIFWFDIAYLIALVFIAFYYTMAGLAATMALKGPLIKILLACRADGSIIEPKDEEEEEETEDE